MREITINNCRDCDHSLPLKGLKTVKCYFEKQHRGVIATSDKRLYFVPIPAWCPIFKKQNPTEGAYMKSPDEFLDGQNKPTIEQVAWVFAHLWEHMQDTGTFRYLIYNRMGFDKSAYYPLYTAGGMAISDGFAELEELVAKDINAKG